MPRSFSFDILPTLPFWAIALIAVALLLLLLQGSLTLLRKQVPAKWVTLLGILRLVIIALFVICLLAPTLSFHTQHRQKPGLLVMLDTSKSMDLPAPQGSQSRLHAALSDIDSGGMFKKLAKEYDLKFYAFDKGARPVKADQLKNLKAIGDTTQYAQSIQDAWQLDHDAALTASSVDHGQSASPAAHRVLLISDGHDVGDTDPAQAARQHGLKVDYLDLGKNPDQAQDQGPGKVVITSLQSQPRVLLGSDAQFLVTLSREDKSTRHLTLALTEDGKAVVTQPVTIDAGQSEKLVRVTYRPQQRGLHKYRVVLVEKAKADDAAAIAAAAESQSTASAYELSLAVLDHSTNVLYIEDTYRWSFRFFKRLMEDDPSFSLTAMLSKGNGVYTRFAEPDHQLDLTGFPQTEADLQAFDIIMLGDANPSYWPRNLAQAIYQAVTRDGKSLVIVAGPNLDQWVRAPELLALLPVDITRGTAKPVEGPIPVHITPEGRSSAFFADPTGIFTQKIPPLGYIYPPVRKRPAATILLEASGMRTQTGDMIAMAEQTVGRGRVLYVGTDTLWKWQLIAQPNKQGVTPYSLFWQQAMRALAPIHRSNAPLQLQTSRSRYQAGQRIELRAILSASQMASNPTVQGSVTLPNDQSTPIAFVAHPTQRGVFVAQFQAADAGTYRIEASAIQGKQTLGEVTQAIDVSPTPGESSHVGINHDTLNRLAVATDGQRVVASDAATWPQPAANAPVTYATVSTHLDLWNYYILMILLCVLLGTDWLIRLLRGYV